MDTSLSVPPSRLDLNYFRATRLRDIEDNYESDVEAPRRVNVHAGVHAMFAKWNYPDAVDGPVRITNLNKEKTTYREIPIEESMNAATPYVGVDLRIIDGFCIGYDYFLPFGGNKYVGEYRYHWSDPDREISDTTEGEIEYIKRRIPEGFHNPYVKFQIPIGSNIASFAWLKLGYQFGKVEFIQGKETYGNDHDAEVIFEDDLEGYNVSAGYAINVIGENRFLFSLEGGWFGMWGDDVSLNGGRLNAGVEVKF